MSKIKSAGDSRLCAIILGMTEKVTRVTICRKISFSSGHRYFNPALTEAENREIFGSAYSSAGHGHNYVLEAHIEGEVDPLTGMVINLKEVDTVLKETTEPLDHQFLNSDIAHFSDVVPTTENLAAYCYSQLRARFERDGIYLKSIRLYEGDDLWVDCGEDSPERDS